MKPHEKSRIRFALVGTGMFARSQHVPNLLSHPDAELVLLCDRDDESLKSAAAQAPSARLTHDFRQAVADPEVDAIVLATTETFRLPLIEAAARAGKPVYCEKPLAKDLADAKRISEIVTESGIPFCVGHNRRCSPAMVDAQRIFSAHLRSPRPCPWRYRREAGVDFPGEEHLAAISIRINDDWWSWKGVHLQGQNAEIGLLISENTHFVDLACWFLGSRPVDVTTVQTGLLNHAVTIRFEGGHLASILSCANGTFGYPKELYEAMAHGGIVVVDGMLEVRTAGIEGAPPITAYPPLGDRHPSFGACGGLHGWLEKKRQACLEASGSGRPMDQFTAEPDKGHARMLGEFIREIRGERPPVSPVQDALLALKVCVASVMSKHERRTVRVDEVNP